MGKKIWQEFGMKYARHYGIYLHTDDVRIAVLAAMVRAAKQEHRSIRFIQPHARAHRQRGVALYYGIERYRLSFVKHGKELMFERTKAARPDYPSKAEAIAAAQVEAAQTGAHFIPWGAVIGLSTMTMAFRLITGEDASKLLAIINRSDAEQGD